MIWPNEALLSHEDWWSVPAWPDGPGYGEVVEAVRPALRAALLLGWHVSAIDVGIGPAGGQGSGWASIELATLELVSSPEMDIDMPFLGPNVSLTATHIVDRLGDLGNTGTYAIPIDIPIFGDDALPNGTVPAGIADGVAAFVDDALSELVATLPADADALPAKAHQQGLLWLLYPAFWSGLNDEATSAIGIQTLNLRRDPLGYLIGEIWAQPVMPPSQDFWTHVGRSAQAEGRAHHLPQKARERLPGMTWLDALGELLWRGVITVPALLAPADPSPPIEALQPTGDPEDPVTELSLAIWGGDSLITLRRVTVFDDEQHEDLTHSVCWDYVPGNAQQRPMVIIVAGRGVQIEADPEVVLVGRSTDAGASSPPPVVTVAAAAARSDTSLPGYFERDPARRRAGLPWDLLLHRVMDDALVPAAGSKIDPLALLSPSVVDPDPRLAVSSNEPCVLVVPKHDGVYLQFPGRGTATPTTSPLSSVDIPRVIELTIANPTSGRSAWTSDAHFFTYPYGQFTAGGAHLCVWVTPDVLVHTNDSPSDPTRGDPSSVAEEYWVSAWRYSAEIWEVNQPAKLARPFSVVLPFTASTAVRPDLLPNDPPPLDYENGRAVSNGITLTPALHAYRQFGYLDSLAFDLIDLIVGFVPFVGDVVDIGEALYALQTGRDKWGRPLSDFELGLMVAGASIPIVSSSVVREIGSLVARAVTDMPVADLGRMATPARWSDDWSLEQINATRGLREVTAADDALVSPGGKAAAGQLLRGLAADDAAIRAAAARLAGSRAAGWPSVADVLSSDGDGFAVPALQTAWLRHHRDNPGAPETPDQFIRWLKAAAP